MKVSVHLYLEHTLWQPVGGTEILLLSGLSPSLLRTYALTERCAMHQRSSYSLSPSLLRTYALTYLSAADSTNDVVSVHLYLEHTLWRASIGLAAPKNVVSVHLYLEHTLWPIVNGEFIPSETSLSPSLLRTYALTKAQTSEVELALKVSVHLYLEHTLWLTCYFLLMIDAKSQSIFT